MSLSYWNTKKKFCSHSCITKGNKRHLGFKHSDEVKLKMSLLKKGKPNGRKGIKTNFVPWNKGLKGFRKGIPRPNWVRKKISNSRKGKPVPSRRGEKSNMWKGGLTPINKIIRGSIEYKLWREAVFKRDNWTCIWCGQKTHNLNADHIKPFAYFPELRFAIDNGRTLCVDCHKKTDTFGGKISANFTN